MLELEVGVHPLVHPIAIFKSRFGVSSLSHIAKNALGWIITFSEELFSGNILLIALFVP